MQISTTATLTQIRDALIAQRPDLATRRAGWGSIEEDPDILGQSATQPPITDPEILPAIPGRRPELLTARFYWFVQNPPRIALYGPRYRINATDVLISDEGNNQFLLFVSSTTGPDIDAQVLPGLQVTIMSVDPSVTISSLDSSLHFQNPDFFFWMVRQHFEQQPIGVGIDIDDIDQVHAQDLLDQQTSIARGVNASRVELLSLLASTSKSFGPASLSVTAPQLGLGLEMRIHLNGEFVVPAQGFIYQGAGFTSTLEERLQVVTDLLYVLLPEMKRKYQADSAWLTGGGRDAFRASIKASAVSGISAL